MFLFLVDNGLEKSLHCCQVVCVYLNLMLAV